MGFDFLVANDTAQALSGVSLPFNVGGLSPVLVSGYPDTIPSGNDVGGSNGWTATDMASALRSVATSGVDVAKTVLGLQSAADQVSLQRIVTSNAVDIAKAQADASKTVAIANANTEAVKAQVALQAAKQSATLNGALSTSSWSSYEVIMLLIAGVGVWYAMKGRRK